MKTVSESGTYIDKVQLIELCQKTIEDVQQARATEESTYLGEHLKRANCWRKPLRLKLLTIAELRAIMVREQGYPMFPMFYGLQEQTAQALLMLAQNSTEDKIWVSAKDFKSVS